MNRLQANSSTLVNKSVRNYDLFLKCVKAQMHIPNQRMLHTGK